MQEKDNSHSFSHSHSRPQNSQSQQDLDVCQILQKSNQSAGNQDKYVSRGQYMKISSKQEKIDTDAIMRQFHRSQRIQKRNKQQTHKKSSSKKIAKLNSSTSKYADFGSIKNKWKAQIDQCIEQYKLFLTQQKKAFDSKNKQNLLKLFRILISGIFELRDCAQSPVNDLTGNEKKIISKQADIGKWIAIIVDQFDIALKQAQKANKIDSWKRKWQALVKNSSDPTNLQLRRKIIRKKVKPIDVITNDDTFLMSQQARIQQQRRNKLILAEAAKNFQKPLQFENQQNNDAQQRKQTSSVQNNSQQLRSNIGSATNLQRRATQQRQRLKQEYKYYLGKDIYDTLKNRVVDLLQGTQAYQILIEDLEQRFKNVRETES